MGLTSFVLGNNQWFEADCMQITLPNGNVINSTTFQRDLVVGGTTYYATKYGKWARGKVTSERNAVTEMDLTLACNEAVSFPIPGAPGLDVPISSAPNLLAYSEQFDNPVWGNAGGSTVTPNNGTDPLGGQTADTINYPTKGANTFAGTYQNSVMGVLVPNTPFCFSVWLKVASGTANVELVLQDNPFANAAASAIVPVTTTWTRFSIAGTFPPAANNAVEVQVRAPYGPASSAYSVLAWGAQLEVGSAPSTYMRSPMVSDNFVRANANPIGAPYASLSGSSVQIVSNAAESTALGVLSNAYNSTVTFTPDHWSEVTLGALVGGGDYVAAFVRMSNNINGYTLYISGPIGAGASWTITRYASGAPTTLTSGTLTAAAGDKFRLEVRGTTLTARQNGTIIAQVTDGTYAAGVPGFGLVNSTTIGNSTITGWTAGNVLIPNASTDNLLASDNFTRANANPAGAPWTPVNIANLQVLSNKLCGTTTGAWNVGVNSAISWSNDQYCEVTVGALPTAGDYIGAAVRMSNGGGAGLNGYIFNAQGSGILYVTRWVNGVNFNIGYQPSATINVGDKLRIEVQGTQITAKQNGNIVFQITDSSVAAGAPGVAFYNPVTIGNSTASNWQGGSVTQGNPNVAMFQKAKLFARAKVQVTIAYMDLGTQTIQGTYVQFVGFITNPVLESSLVTFRCSDPGYKMLLTWPRRVIQAGCPFAVFDPLCTLNKSSFQVNGVVAYGSSGTNLNVAAALGSIGNDSLPFSQGYILPTTGQCAGWMIRIVTQNSGTNLTLAPFDLPLQVGDKITLVPGCDHKQTTCQLKYNNVANYGGFPYVPGPESSITGN